MEGDWQMKYKIKRDYKNNRDFVVYNGKKIGGYQRIWTYGTFYTENSIHFIVEENGKYKWVTYDRNGKLLGETIPYKKIKILKRNSYEANGIKRDLDDYGREIDKNSETTVKRHNREDSDELSPIKLSLDYYLKNRNN